MIQATKNEFEKTLINNAHNATWQYYTPLLHQTENATKPNVGSGTFASIAGIKGILTNAHVAELFELPGCVSPINIPIPHHMPQYEDQVIVLPFTLVIQLPKLADFPDVDMAFIILDPRCHDILEKIGKKFWDLDQSILEQQRTSRENLNIYSDIWLIHGCICEGRKLQDRKNGRPGKVLFFKNEGSYFVRPDLKNITTGTCSYKINEKSFAYIVDRIFCPIKTQMACPLSFDGMSGGALWRIILDQNGIVQKLFLIGVATEYGPPKKAETIVCRGPDTLYKSFYPYCLGALYARQLEAANTINIKMITES